MHHLHYFIPYYGNEFLDNETARLYGDEFLDENETLRICAKFCRGTFESLLRMKSAVKLLYHPDLV